MDLFIRNMVCLRCKLIVRDVLEKLNIPYSSIEIGQVMTEHELTNEQMQQLNTELKKYDLELVFDRKYQLTQQIRNIIIENIHLKEEMPEIKFSVYLSKKLHYNYTYLSNIFKQVYGKTIEQFIIAHKIEKVKALFMYDHLSFNQIADKMHYSSLAHLSSQFKKVTGLTLTTFKKMNRTALAGHDQI